MFNVYNHLTCVVFYLLTTLVITSQVNVTILHTNDIHSRFESYNRNIQACTQSEVINKQCWGGSARMLTAVKKLRSGRHNVLLLDAGDQFQGSVWYTLMKWRPVVAAANLMNYTASALGNHEFDDGDDNLADYLNRVNFPVLACNVDARNSSIDGLYNDYIIKSVGGQQIAIIGYLTPETLSIASPSDNVRIKNEIVSLKQTIQKIKATHKNINKFIGLGHSGVDFDRKVCEQVPEIDVVVGGHSHTFLYTGTPPASFPDPEGPYPIVVDRPHGRACLVVQASAYGQYLGMLELQFDDVTGNLERWSGKPVLVDSTFEQDPEMLNALSLFERKLTHLESLPLATTSVTMVANGGLCRVKECKIGNVATDALLEYAREELTKMISTASLESFGFNASEFQNEVYGLSVLVGGTLRQFSVQAKSQITMSMIYTLMPFFNTIKILQVNGSVLRQVFERSVERFSLTSRHGKFLQLANGKVVYKKNCADGDFHVADLRVGCLIGCRRESNGYSNMPPITDDGRYILVTTNYVASGGDGYSMLVEGARHFKGADDIDTDIVVRYIKKLGVLNPVLQDRITFDTSDRCKRHLNIRFWNL